MFGSFLGKKKDTPRDKNSSDITLKVSKMNLTEMRSYVNNKIIDFEISEDGLIAVMKKLTVSDEKSSKTYLQIDDMDSKKKKGFDLVLIIANNRYISVESVELMQNFIEVYEELISKFDQDYKEIYSSRLTDAITLAIKNVNIQSELKRKEKVLGN